MITIKGSLLPLVVFGFVSSLRDAYFTFSLTKEVPCLLILFTIAILFFTSFFDVLKTVRVCHKLYVHTYV